MPVTRAKGFKFTHYASYLLNRTEEQRQAARDVMTQRINAAKAFHEKMQAWAAQNKNLAGDVSDYPSSVESEPNSNCSLSVH